MYEELKKLAKAASNGPWFTNDWSDDFGDDKTTIEFHTEEVVEPGSHGIWPDGVHCHRVASTEDGENPLADAEFIAAANPSAVLELIAERDQLFGQAVQLKAENEALRKDAERYRWLRGNHIFAHVQVEQSDGTQPYVYDSELDRSVDEIISALNKDTGQ